MSGMSSVNKPERGPAPKAGRQYYETVLARCDCSPSGVLAALVPGEHDRVTTVAAASTWPWEFDAHQWLLQAGPHGGGEDTNRALGAATPDFERYSPTFVAPGVPRQAADIANALAEQLRLPTSTKLRVITLP